MNNFKTLSEFIDRAVKSRKYPESTAQTLRAALNLYEPILHEEERNSLEKFEKDFEQITASVFSKNANRFNVSSLTTYKSRVQKVLNDFNKYGDPAKMNSWNPKVIVRMKKTISQGQTNKEKPEVATQEIPNRTSENMHKIELALRPDAKFIIIVPRDMNKSEAITIKAIIDSLANNEQ